MTKIKLCGLSRPCDIQFANDAGADYIGFVFAPRSRRYVPPDTAARLKGLLRPGIAAVGVFVDEAPERVADLLNRDVIDMAQLHGGEDEDYIGALRALTPKPLIQAFPITSARDIARAQASTADHILLDSGAGTGTVFDWGLIGGLRRPYFLAGGLGLDNIRQAVAQLHPFAVDVSSGIETDGKKDGAKMAAFAAAVRKEDKL